MFYNDYYCEKRGYVLSGKSFRSIISASNYMRREYFMTSEESFSFLRRLKAAYDRKVGNMKKEEIKDEHAYAV